GYVDDVDSPIYDFGLAHLVVQDFGPELGPFVPVASASDDYFHGLGTSLFTAGYPGDKPLGTMWESIAPVEYVDDELIHTRMDAYPGQSGSPVFTLNFERVEAFIVGTYSTETAVSNRAVRFSPRHIDALNDYCADAGCTLSTAIVAAPTTTAVASPSPSPTPTATSTPTPTSTSIPSPSFPVRSRIPHLGRD
ncbi:MAG: serine protease, partial [Dehalococcoidia bacterium]